MNSMQLKDKLKNISKEKKEKIINTIMKDKVPDNVDKMF